MPLRMGKGRNKKKAPATILFTSEDNEEGKRQSCVYASCQMSGHSVGPIWGHGEKSIKRVLATLTEQCDCPARYHANREQVEG
jgi:hypothetical protein